MFTTFGPTYVIFKKAVAIISAIVMMVVASDEKNQPKPDGAEVINKNTYVLYDYYMSSQGVTNDGEYFYFSGKKNLGKARMKNGEIFLINTSPIPEELETLGCNHIGGLTCHNGYIYAAVEDGPDYQHPCIALYDAKTLKYTGVYYELPQELHLEGVPWCAADEERGYLYTAEWSNAEVLNVFDLETLELVKTIPLSEPVDRIQGAELFGDTLYMSSDEENDMKRIFSVNVLTGEVNVAFSRNVGKEIEAEDMTVYADESGSPVLCVIDRGARRRSTNLTYYRLTY